MITGIFGLPGSGKTCFLTHLALTALAGKEPCIGMFSWRVPVGDAAPYKRIFTNFPVKGCIQLNFDDLGKYDFSDSLILIDEIMLLCDSRDWKNFPARLRNFLALHRHYHCSLVYCSQGYRDTDLRFRNLTERIFYIEKRGAWSKVAPIEKTWRIDQDIAEGYSLAPPLGCSWIYRPRYYQSYDSFEAKPFPKNPALPWHTPDCVASGFLRCFLCAQCSTCQQSKWFRLHEWRKKNIKICVHNGTERNGTQCPLEPLTSDLRGVSVGGSSDTCKPFPALYDASDKWDFWNLKKPSLYAEKWWSETDICSYISFVKIYATYTCGNIFRYRERVVYL